ncbi:MAG: SCP2 sterol-binding domain-containing protein [Candidatus Odinarchaeota archaeon]
MVKFLTEDWILDYKDVLNASEAYAEAAKDWEGDFFFIVTDAPDGKTHTYYIDLWHGKARDAYLVTDDKKPEKDPEYHYKGSYENWIEVVEGRLDPIKGLMVRKFHLKGNMAKVLKATKAAKELVACAAKVPTEFE